MPDITRMKVQAVDSTNIEAIGYSRRLMLVTFKNRGNPTTYIYRDVPRSAYNALMAADSIGAHFAEHVRNTYTFERLEAVMG